MTGRQLRFRLGIFAIFALVLLATMIVLFGSLPPMFKRTNEYTIRFTDAPNLRPGSPVRRSGVRIGEVKDLALNDQTGKVDVHVDIEKNYTVRQSEQPTLNLTLLGNDASIDFIPKPVPAGQEPDRTPIPPGSEIDGVVPVSVNTLISRASDVVPTTQETMNDIRRSLKRMEEMAPLMEQTMKEYRDLGRSLNKDYPDLVTSVKGSVDDFGAASREYRRLGENLNVFLLTNQDKVVQALNNVNIILDRVLLLLSDANIKNVTAILQNVRDASAEAPAIAKNVREASEQFPSIAKNTDELVKESRATLKSLQQTLTKFDAAMADLQKAMQPIGERGPTIMKNLDESFDKLNRTMTDVRELMRVLDQSDGTFKRILTDPTLYNNLEQTTCALAKMMPQLTRILKNLETFADKLARHPELIGVGGALKPSDGLTDPPNIGTHPR